LATVDVFEEVKTLEQLQPKVARIAEHLQRIAQHPHVGDVRQRGLIAGIELVRDRATREAFPWEEKRGLQVCDWARAQGVHLRPLGSVLVILPPLSVTLSELDRICTALEGGIQFVTGK
jgi:adenosylmethionine-8-amino-7-oxononanoate aminotransferase